MRDVIDHVTRVLERPRASGELLGNILTVNATLVAQRQNEEMTRLTEAGYQQNEQMKRVSSWAAILFAPTLIGGIYGMNFDHMPELHWAFGYPFAIGLMLLLGLGLYAGVQTPRLAVEAGRFREQARDAARQRSHDSSAYPLPK